MTDLLTSGKRLESGVYLLDESSGSYTLLKLSDAVRARIDYHKSLLEGAES